MVMMGSILVVHGGIAKNSIVSNDLWTLQPGCNSGEYGEFHSEGCRPCDVGHYSEESGPICDKCSLFFSTTNNGSTSSENCSLCSGICNFGGSCSVRKPNVEYDCHCRFPFSGNTCQNFWPLLVFLACLLVSISVVYLIYRIVHHVKRAKRDAQQLIEKDQEIGGLIDGWRIEDDEVKFVRKLGEGGFGEVWLAEYREIQVAVKILNENERLFVSSSNEDFQREIDFMRHLRHPNIVLFLGAGSFTTDGNLFLVTEYVKRGSLHAVLVDLSIPLSNEQKLKFCLDSAMGMRFLHELKPSRIHRDLKAANLLVSQNWVVKVSDFGTSRRLLKPGASTARRQEDGTPVDENSDAETSALLLERYQQLSWRLGTTLWKAPELLKREAYGASVDVYSFGIVLWEIFVRRNPYDDIQLPNLYDDLIKLICDEGHRPTLSEGFPEDVAILMQNCWHTNPEMRPTFPSIVRRLQQATDEN